MCSEKMPNDTVNNLYFYHIELKVVSQKNECHTQNKDLFGLTNEMCQWVHSDDQIKN